MKIILQTLSLLFLSYIACANCKENAKTMVTPIIQMMFPGEKVTLYSSQLTTQSRTTSSFKIHATVENPESPEVWPYHVYYEVQFDRDPTNPCLSFKQLTFLYGNM